jgi:predicted phosphodiesterase
MCSVKKIDLTGIDKIVVTPPEGYGVAFAFFKSDGSFVAAGSANTTSHPEYINYIWTIDTRDYVKCGITVGRFPNTEGQKGADYASDETFVNSVGMTVYYKTRNRIYDYYTNEMDQTIETVRNCLTEPALVFPVITDIHYLSQSGSFNHGAENIREFCKRVKVDFVLNLGDNTDGNIDPAYTILRNMFMLDRFTEINAPYYQAIGNHDVNGYKSTEKLTPEEIYKSYLSNTHGVRFDMTAGETNYYKDFDELGIRLIVLDIDHNAGWVYSDNTVTWLRDVALDTKNIVVLAEHMSSIPTQNWNGASVVNGTEVTAVLQAFVDGGGKLIQLCGHSHADYYFTTPWLTIFTVCQKFEKVDVTDPNYSEDIQGNVGDIVAPDRTEFTASEDAWTVFIIKPVSGKVDAIRFGAGSDMHYDF